MKRLSELSGDDEYKLSRYMLMLETLSDNRNLKSKIKEVEIMLRDTRYQDLPSFEIGMERGISQGISQGILQGQLESAYKMISELNLSIDKIANILNISADSITEYIEKNKK